MVWQIALSILIAINISALILTKIATDRLPKKALGLFYVYLFCVSLAIGYFFFFGKTGLTPLIILIATIGFINAFGSYFLWQASQLSLSKTVIFFPMMQVIAIALAIIFLAEAKLWNLQLTLGVGLCLLAMWLFRVSRGTKDKTKEVLTKKWLFFVLPMVAIFGACEFLVKFFSFDIPRETFILGWYIGGFLGALLILGLKREKPILIPGKMILLLIALSFAVFGVIFVLYWTYQLGGSVSLVSPLRGLGITVIPAFFGWFIFKERKGFSKREWFGFLVGIVGAILILFR